MFILDDENIKVLPVDFVAYFLDAQRYKEKNRYSNSQNINEDTCNIIAGLINVQGNENFLAIDMKNIKSYPMRIFSDINSCNPYIFFFNIETENIVLRMKEDMRQLVWLQNNTIACFSNEKIFQIEQLVNDCCNQVRKKRLISIIDKKLIRNDRSPYKLESSGLYSNCYLSVKRLFGDVENLYFVTFAMARRIAVMPKFDAFVTSSKNGAIIATILADMLRIKEVHLIGIGPKYSMELGDSIESIKEGKRYLYIFDFMCTGAEFKIVSALINSKRAQLKGAVGISRFMKENQSFRENNVEVLVEAEELGTSYIIAGTVEDINRLERINNNDK